MEWNYEFSRVRKELNNLQDVLRKEPSKKRVVVCERKFKKEKNSIQNLIDTAASEEDKLKAQELKNIFDACERQKVFEILSNVWS